jgi:surface polysaccharide O-acyltransferase-like enzyme
VLPRTEGEREFWVDWLKAAAIVTVVCIHAGTFVGRPDTAVTRAMSGLFLFAVRSFFFVAGYTLGRSSGGWSAIQKRIVRIGGPYLVASALVLLWFSPPLWEVPGALLGGTALGIYYFVPMLIACTVVVALLGMLPRRFQLPLLAAIVLSGPIVVAGYDPIVRWVYPRGSELFWINRSPLRWMPYLAAGFLLARCVESIRARHAIGALCAALALVLAVVPALLDIPRSGWLWAMTTVSMTYLVIFAWIFWIGPRGAAPAVVRLLSENTLPIYLYHFPVVFGCAYLGVFDSLTRSPRQALFVLVGTAIPLGVAYAIKAWRPGAAKWVG